jgi:hypothetical protein
MGGTDRPSGPVPGDPADEGRAALLWGRHCQRRQSVKRRGSGVLVVGILAALLALSGCQGDPNNVDQNSSPAGGTNGPGMSPGGNGPGGNGPATPGGG